MEETAKIGFEIADIPVQFDVTVMITTTITSGLVFLLAYAGARNLKMVPSGIQNLIEAAINFVKGIVNTALDPKQAERFYAFGFTLFFFIFIANELGLMFNVVTIAENGHHYAWWMSPTANISVVFAMAIAISLGAHILGAKKSFKGYVSHYFKPYWWMFPLHIIDELAKPLTHGIRLWANIFAGEIMILVLLQVQSIFAGGPMILWLGYSIVIGGIQAYVFTLLAFLYFSQKLSTEH